MAAAIAPVFAEGAACRARSPAHTVAFVELYTAEACSSCPEADHWLSGVAGAYPRERLAALALAVDYWDYLGWKDPAARRDFSQRQRRLSHLQRRALVYTPQVVLQGAEFRQWRSTEFDRAVERINARTAGAHISLAIAGASDAAFRVVLEARADAEPDARVYLAAYDSGPRGGVPVALEWRGPLGIGKHEIELPLLPKARAAESGAAAFVQSRRTGEVLQAVMLAACGP